VSWQHFKQSAITDRFTRGFIAGLIASIPVTIVNLVSHYLFQTISYAHFAAIMIFGHTFESTLELLFAIGCVIFFEAGLGGIFAYLITGLTSKNLLFKGWIFGLAVWFISYVITLLFKVPGLAVLPLKSSCSNLISSSIYGLVLAYILMKLNRRLY